MQITSFFQKFGRDLVYLSIIAGILAWICMEDRRQLEYNKMIFRDMKGMGDIILFHNQDLLAKIERNSASSESEEDKKDGLKAIFARNQVVAYHDMISKMMNTLWAISPENRYEFYRPISAQDLESLQVFTKRLCDSLVKHSDHDEYVATKLKHFLSQDSTSAFWKIVKNAKAPETGVLLEDLLRRSDLANETVLNYLLRKTSPQLVVNDNWHPIVSAKKSVIYPGQTYTAEIFLGQYSKSKKYERNITIKVDGKPFSIIDGLAHFSKRYTTPGEKKYRVDIDIKNPVTKHVTTLTKEFALLVIDSCR